MKCRWCDMELMIVSRGDRDFWVPTSHRGDPVNSYFCFLATTEWLPHEPRAKDVRENLKKLASE